MSGNVAVKIVGVGSQVSKSPHRFVSIVQRSVSPPRFNSSSQNHRLYVCLEYLNGNGKFIYGHTIFVDDYSKIMSSSLG